jgi:phage tail sheath protein FI
MPLALTYPGVYIQELPSGTRTVTGVATSITAFVGRTLAGYTNTATTIHSFGEFERLFGGLWIYSPLSFAVRDFFANGGAAAVIVRLFHDDSTNSLPDNSPISIVQPNLPTTKPLPAGFAGPTSATPAFTLTAATPGSWGGDLRVTVDGKTATGIGAQLGPTVTDDQVFNLTVVNSRTGATEVHRNVTVVDSVRRLDIVLTNNSDLVRWTKVTFSPALSFTTSSLWYDAITATQLAVDAGTQLGLSSADMATLQGFNDSAKSHVKAQDGTYLTLTDDFAPTGGLIDKKGLYALEQVDLFNLLVIPPNLQPTDPITDGDVDTALIAVAAGYCETRRAMLIVDSPYAWNTKKKAVDGINNTTDQIGTRSKNAALFFPRLKYPNPFRFNQPEAFIAGGAVAGIMARTDSTRGVWKAPAGLDATLVGVPELSVDLTDPENGDLNPLAVNCLRTRPAAGRVVWGARTLQGDDRLLSDWKYIPVRRTALFIEESVFRGTQWVVFEPNDEPLWAQIRFSIGGFMQTLFLEGAFQGRTPKEAYFVKCDQETTTQVDINNGIVNIIVGFAPLKPAEFVVISLQQMAGQTAA